MNYFEKTSKKRSTTENVNITIKVYMFEIV